MRVAASTRAFAILMLLSLVWATLFLAVKIGDKSIAPITLMFDRALIATLSLLPFALFSYFKRQGSSSSFTVQQLLCSAVVGALIAYMWIAIAVAEVVISSGVAALLTSSIYLFSWILSVAFCRTKKFHLTHAIGVVIATMGLAFSVGIQHLLTHFDQLDAMLLFVSGFFAFAISGLLSRQYTNNLPVMEMTTLNLLFTTVFLWLGGLFHVMPWHQSASLIPLLSVIWAGLISTAFGYYLYYHLLNSSGPLFANNFGYCVPVFGLMLSVLLMGMTVTWPQVLAIPLLLFGIYLINLKL